MILLVTCRLLYFTLHSATYVCYSTCTSSINTGSYATMQCFGTFDLGCERDGFRASFFELPRIAHIFKPKVSNLTPSDPQVATIMSLASHHTRTSLLSTATETTTWTRRAPSIASTATYLSRRGQKIEDDSSDDDSVTSRHTAVGTLISLDEDSSEMSQVQQTAHNALDNLKETTIGHLRSLSDSWDEFEWHGGSIADASYHFQEYKKAMKSFIKAHTKYIKTYGKGSFPMIEDERKIWDYRLRKPLVHGALDECGFKW